MQASLNVAIVGCGMAGATAALLLSRSGHHVTLYERAPVVGPVGAGILLQPSGQAVLSRIGLLEKVIARAEPIDRLHAITHRQKTLVNLPYAEVSPGFCAYGLHRGDLFSVLHQELLASSVDLKLGCEISSTSDGRLPDCDLIIAADGARSAMRGSSSLKHHVYEYPHAAVWATGICKTISRKLFQVTRGSKQLCGLLPTGEGRCSLFWSLPNELRDTFLQSSFEDWKAEVLALAPEAKEIFQTVTSMKDLRITGYWHVTMPRWHDGKTVFIGDSAHAMSPHLGQGINLALIDAECLANCINESTSLIAALNQYELRRRGQVRFYSRVTRMLSPFFQSKGFIKGLGRDVFLPFLPGIPYLRRQMLLTMSGLKTGFFR